MKPEASTVLRQRPRFFRGGGTKQKDESLLINLALRNNIIAEFSSVPIGATSGKFLKSFLPTFNHFLLFGLWGRPIFPTHLYDGPKEMKASNSKRLK